jgi:predicted MFS family arabinose efflux permease
VLALPDLYSAFNTSVVGVSWVITSYNLVVCVAAFVLVPFTRRLHVREVARAGLTLFTAGSVGCAAAWTLPVLIGWRCVQGVGAALLLAAALPILGGLMGSIARGSRTWTATGTFGAALGPALGGVLTQLADWRAIFIVQAPVGAIALAATFDHRVHAISRETQAGRARRNSLPANVALALVFGALVGALFLAVLLVITVWEREPIVGALIVSALPAATLAARPLTARLPASHAVIGGALLLAAGLIALALLPRVSNTLVAVCLAFCGLGLGLAVPTLTRAAMDPERAALRSGTVTVGARHLGLVVALVLIAPLLGSALDRVEHQALLAGTRVILDGNVDLAKKVPIALDLRDEFAGAAKAGEVPDLAKPFDERGAKSDSSLRALRNELLDTLRGVITRSFRSSFFLSALFALVALAPALVLKRREA